MDSIQQTGMRMDQNYYQEYLKQCVNQMIFNYENLEHALDLECIQHMNIIRFDGKVGNNIFGLMKQQEHLRKQNNHLLYMFGIASQMDKKLTKMNQSQHMVF